MCLAAVYSIGVGFVLRLKDTDFSDSQAEITKKIGHQVKNLMPEISQSPADAA